MGRHHLQRTIHHLCGLIEDRVGLLDIQVFGFGWWSIGWLNLRIADFETLILEGKEAGNIEKKIAKTKTSRYVTSYCLGAAIVEV